MWSNGEARAAGQEVIGDYLQLPAASVTDTYMFNQREVDDKVFAEGDSVLMVLDCTAHTLRLTSAAVQYVIDIQQQHHHQAEWVLNVNFGDYDQQVKLLC